MRSNHLACLNLYMSSAVVIVFLVLFLFLSFYISVCLDYLCNSISYGHKILKCLQENITVKKRINKDNHISGRIQKRRIGLVKYVDVKGPTI